jgi:Spy/CpxP family protein refolding chaperone
MKKSIKASLALFVLTSGLVVPSLRAEEPAAPSADAPAPKAKRHSPFASLNLTADQQKQVDAIVKDEKTSLDAVKADTTLTKDAKKSKADEIKAAHHAQIRDLLTPEQQAKFDAMPAPHARKDKATP